MAHLFKLPYLEQNKYFKFSSRFLGTPTILKPVSSRPLKPTSEISIEVSIDVLETSWFGYDEGEILRNKFMQTMQTNQKHAIS
jgi:hypothetical protein